MADPGTALVLGGGLAAAQGGLSYGQARAQNTAIRRSMSVTQHSSQVEGEQIDAAARVEQQKRQNEAGQILGHIRVATAANGTGVGGTYNALQQQAAYDEATNTWIAEQNRRNEQARLVSQTTAALTELSNRHVNTALATLTGGLSGASTGLNLYASGKTAEVWK